MRPNLQFSLLLFGVTLFVTVGTAFADVNQKMDTINLLAPLGNSTTVEAGGGINTVINYFNDVGEWMMMVAVGLCVLWVLYGGILLMFSGADSSHRSKGIEHMKWSIVGLCILFFSGFLLRTLNSIFFK